MNTKQLLNSITAFKAGLEASRRGNKRNRGYSNKFYNNRKEYTGSDDTDTLKDLNKQLKSLADKYKGEKEVLEEQAEVLLFNN